MFYKARGHTFRRKMYAFLDSSQKAFFFHHHVILRHERESCAALCWYSAKAVVRQCVICSYFIQFIIVMVNYCVCGDCTNSSLSGHRVHRFPNEKWTVTSRPRCISVLQHGIPKQEASETPSWCGSFGAHSTFIESRSTFVQGSRLFYSSHTQLYRI